MIPLHKSIYRVLSQIPQDMTFDQLKIRETLGKWSSYHCLDLTAATDRFPVVIQEDFISYLVDKPYAQAWRRIMTKLPFNHEGKDYCYNAGQPMGAYSSWAVFALTHHSIVKFSAYLCGVKTFTDYALLGDDLVIGSKPVADKYREVMKDFGVQISEAKTHEG